MKKGSHLTEAQKRKLSKAHKGQIPWNKGKTTGEPSWNRGKPHTEETKGKMSKSHKGKLTSDVTKRKLSTVMRGKPPHNKGKPTSDVTKERMSATRQGIPYDEWESFACEMKYCPKFNEACKEANRAKYGYKCFMCGKPQSKNIGKGGKVRKLSVHHVDLDKAQGCDSRWKLVPLCMKCHPGTHNDEMIARLGYILKKG